jgi:SulP family sulfate permease
MAGMLQIAGGMAGVGKLLKLIPHPVMLGFVNGLAIVMTKAQLMHFKTGGTFMSLTTPLGASTYGIAALTMALVKLIPKVT